MRKSVVLGLSLGLFVSMVLWGFWTLIVYLGIPSHGAVLVPGGNAALESACDPNAILCRGFYTLFPFIGATLTRVPFIMRYAIACMLVYGCVMIWNYLRTLRATKEWVVTPWKILLLFVGILWLFFTMLTFSQNGERPFRRIVEPLPQVYTKAGAEALETLKINYAELEERNCLTQVGMFGPAKDMSISTGCLQSAFFTRVLPPLFFILLFAFQFLVLGRAVLRRVFSLDSFNDGLEFLFSLGLGACLWIVFLWLGAVLHVYTATYGWILLVLLPIAFYKETIYWIQKFTRSSKSITLPWYSLSVFALWFLLSYLAFNYINVVRPFPIGWDDLGSYLNRPRLLVSYGELVFSMSTFQWEYITSLGFLLFGFGSEFGATVSLMTNWFAGVLAILSIYFFSRTFLGEGRGILSATLYYTLPLVGHFSYADMKIDNAVFSMGALAFLCVFLYLFSSDDEERPPTLWMLALGGLFAGFAFGMKSTAIMVAMTLGTLLLGVKLHPVAFLGGVFASLGVFAKQGILRAEVLLPRLGFDVMDASSAQNSLFFTCAIFALVLIGVAILLRQRALKRAAIAASIFIAGFVAAIYPWLQNNSWRQGSILPGMYLSPPNNLGYIVDPHIDRQAEKVFKLPEELRADQAHPTCKPSGAKEELDRYWGNHEGIGHYLKLPWRAVMNLDHAGYYVTLMPSLLLFPLVLLLPFTWKRKGKWLRWLWASTVFLLLQWILLANGIPWYGIGTFLGLVVCLEALVAKAPDPGNRVAARIFLTLSILTCLGMRYWQYDTQRNLFEYSIGKVSADAMRERTIPHYDDIAEIVIQRHEFMPDRPLLYRVGTFIPYFIPRNLEVIGVTDHQLDFFNCIYQERDVQLTLKRLKGLGFNSIIFDTNTATIEKDRNGSLHQKVQAFADFLNASGLKVVINDPGAGVAFFLIP